jgi:hypothetical protein
MHQLRRSSGEDDLGVLFVHGISKQHNPTLARFGSLQRWLDDASDRLRVRPTTDAAPPVVEVAAVERRTGQRRRLDAPEPTGRAAGRALGVPAASAAGRGVVGGRGRATYVQGVGPLGAPMLP